jgi:hypothetical protein
MPTYFDERGGLFIVARKASLDALFSANLPDYAMSRPQVGLSACPPDGLDAEQVQATLGPGPNLAIQEYSTTGTGYARAGGSTNDFRIQAAAVPYLIWNTNPFSFGPFTADMPTAYWAFCSTGPTNDFLIAAFLLNPPVTPLAGDTIQIPYGTGQPGVGLLAQL